ncbi:hypothetical protein CBOM_02354 [Ceraceosorus bombacis]|uniref:Uncharacterized protein n=1 Tax=Ceraceosorus bombacis TaxID=401625 RepID=A0A0N7L9R4_9BASI|nr:hypothetical protein CBOM_02354 [Ceraceosorus bombacis]
MTILLPGASAAEQSPRYRVNLQTGELHGNVRIVHSYNAPLALSSVRWVQAVWAKACVKKIEDSGDQVLILPSTNSQRGDSTVVTVACQALSEDNQYLIDYSDEVAEGLKWSKFHKKGHH